MVVGRHHDDGRALVDQRDRAVFQLAGGVSLGVDVGDLLELERAFHGDRERLAAAEIEHVARLREFAGERLDLRLEAHRLVHQGRSPHRRSDEVGLGLLVEDAAGASGLDGEGEQRRELAAEGFRRGDADLGPREGRGQDVRLASHRRRRHVDDGHDGLAVLLGVA